MRIPAAVVDQFANLVPVLLGTVPAEQRSIIRLLLEVAAGAQLVGPPDPPPAFLPLFQDVERTHGLPPELLAAMAGVLTGYDPDHVGGIMALPAAGYNVTTDALHRRDPEALARVRDGVLTAADLILDLRTEQPHALPAAVYIYVERSQRAAETVPNPIRDRRIAGEILGAFAIMAARRLRRPHLDSFGEMLGGD